MLQRTSFLWIFMLMALIASACQPAPTATVAPQPTPAPTAMLSDEQKTQILAGILADIPKEQYTFLQDKDLLAYLENGGQAAATPVPVPTSPQEIVIKTSDGTEYEFVYYPPAQAPAAALVIYFPIFTGLDKDTDFPFWLFYFHKAITVVPTAHGGGKLAAPRPQNQVDAIALMAMKNYPGCEKSCSVQKVTQNQDQWKKSFSEAMQQMEQKLATGEIPGLGEQYWLSTMGKSLGGTFAIAACNMLKRCQATTANSPWNNNGGFIGTSSMGQRMKEAGKQVNIYAYDNDPALKEFRDMPGANIYTTPGNEHGVPLSKLTRWEGGFNLWNCQTNVDASSAKANLEQKKAQLAQKQGELDDLRNVFARMVKAILNDDLNGLAIIIGTSFDGGFAAGLAIQNQISSDMSDEQKNKVKETWINYINEEAKHLKDLEAAEKSLRQEVENLEHQIFIEQYLCQKP